MLEKLRRGEKIVGSRRLGKAIEAGEIAMVFVALVQETKLPFLQEHSSS